VAGRLGLLGDGLVILAVVAVDLRPLLTLPAADVEEEPRELEVLVAAGDVGELDQRQLDFLVSGHVVAFLGPEDAGDVVGELDRDVQQRLLAGGAIVSDGRLEEMPGAVQLVAGAAVRPPALRLLERVVAVEVAVGLLGGGDPGDDLVDLPVEVRVAVGLEQVGSALQHLVDVGVVEVNALKAAFHEAAGLGEIAEAPGLPAPLEVVRDRPRAVRLDARGPEFVLDGHLGERHGLELAQRLGRGCKSAHRACRREDGAALRESHHPSPRAP